MLQFFLSQKLYRVTVILLILLILCGTLSLFFLGWQNQKSVEAEYNNDLQQQLELRLGLLKDKFKDSQSQIGFLHATPPIKGIVRAIANNGFDPVDQNSLQLWRERLHIIFKAFIEQNPNIAFIRFIGAANQGKELVRVERTQTDVTAVADENLQYKGNRDYFYAASRLKPNEIYLSDITLNQEFGKIEQPPRPTYRTLKSVFDDKGNFFGFVIINYNAQALLDTVTSNLSSDQALFLLNKNRQFIINTLNNSAFAFDYGNTEDWSNFFAAPNTFTANNRSAIVHEKSTEEDYFYIEQAMAINDDLHLPMLTLGLAYKTTHVRHEVLSRQLAAFTLVLLAMAVIFAILSLYRQYSDKSHQEMSVKARLQAMVNGSKDAIITMAANTTVTYCNKATCLMFDRTEAQIVGQPFFTVLIPEDEREAAERHFQKVLLRHELPTFNIKLNTTQISKHLEITFSPKKSNDGELLGVAAIVRDITTATEQAHNLMLLNEQLKEKNAEMEHFVYTISHDLKAPIVTIGGFSQKILATSANELSEKNLHLLNRIIANTSHMESLVGELLNISQVIHSELDVTDCDIEECINEVLELLDAEINHSQATLKLQLSCHSMQVNKGMLMQCLQNLIGNALIHRSDAVKPEITLSTLRDGDLVRLSVADNGAGIDAAFHDKIFKLFERISEKPGTGVGLTIVKSAMEKHHGWVEVQSELGCGSTFTLCFPQAPR